jgi:hypothetical protein
MPDEPQLLPEGRQGPSAFLRLVAEEEATAKTAGLWETVLEVPTKIHHFRKLGERRRRAVTNAEQVVNFWCDDCDLPCDPNSDCCPRCGK